MDMNKFGERITIYRQNKNLTQEEFASRIGVTAQAVSKWERGQSLPDLGLLYGICNILEVDANEILHIDAKSHIVEKNDISTNETLLSNLCAEPIRIIFGNEIIEVFIEGLKTDLISKKRLQIAREKGMLIPIIRIVDDIHLHEREFQIVIYDRVLYKEELVKINEISYEYIIDKLFQTALDNYALILNKQIVKLLIDNIRINYPGVVDEIIPEKISYLFVKKVLEGLINHQMSIHNLITILEIIEEEVLIHNNIDTNSVINKIIKILSIK